MLLRRAAGCVPDLQCQSDDPCVSSKPTTEVQIPLK